MKEVREFLTKCDHDYNPYNTRDDVKLEIFNSNVSLDEVESAIMSLRNNKSAGTDYIPAEFIKYYMAAMFGESTVPTMTPSIKCSISMSGVFSRLKLRRVT